MLPVTCHLHCLANHPCLTPCKIGTSLFPSISWTVSIWNKAPTYFPFKLCNLHCVTMIHNTFYGSPASFQCPEHTPQPPTHPPPNPFTTFSPLPPPLLPQKDKAPNLSRHVQLLTREDLLNQWKEHKLGEPNGFFPFFCGNVCPRRQSLLPGGWWRLPGGMCLVPWALTLLR